MIKIKVEKKDCREKISVIYAGSPGKSKELLYPIIKALSQTPFSDRFDFHIYGCTMKQVHKNIGKRNVKFLASNIIIHGRM